MTMITDKILEGVFEPASKYFTRWRVMCFLFAVFMQTKSYELFIDKGLFDMGAQDAATKIINTMSGVSVFFLCLYAFLAFWLSPKLHSWICLVFVRVELHRVSKKYVEVAGIVSASPLASLIKDYENIRSRAIQGEKRIIGLLNCGEVLFFLVLFGLFSIDYNGLSLAIYLAFIIPVPLLLFFLTQKILAEYLRSVLYFKFVFDRVQPGAP